MPTTNSSTKKKRNPVVQVVLKPELHQKFIQRCEFEQRSESAMGAILIAQALNDDSSANASAYK